MAAKILSNVKKINIYVALIIGISSLIIYFFDIHDRIFPKKHDIDYAVEIFRARYEFTNDQFNFEIDRLNDSIVESKKLSFEQKERLRGDINKLKNYRNMFRNKHFECIRHIESNNFVAFSESKKYVNNILDIASTVTENIDFGAGYAKSINTKSLNFYYLPDSLYSVFDKNSIYFEDSIIINKFDPIRDSIITPLSLKNSKSEKGFLRIIPTQIIWELLKVSILYYQLEAWT